jgi:predicted Ser/Thr protein kinase
MAVQLGAITESQLEECLREREKDLGPAGTVIVKPVHTVAIEKGFLTEKLILELAAEQKRLKEGSSVSIQVTMNCAACNLDHPLPLQEALTRPRCKKCNALLTVRTSSAATTVKIFSGPLPPDVQRALENPKNRFGKYVLLSKLGQGGMGEVFKAWDTVLGRQVALKMPRSVGEDEIRRLYLEAQGAGRLSHPNIASVYEISEIDGRHYIAMQFIEGKTAEQAGAATPAPPVREMVRWIRDAALAAHYAHERGVIHRDFKPQNLMIDNEGRVYVMDFGLAKLSTGETNATVSGAILGTPSFMSPEQASGRPGEVDKRSDVYSLGSTLYVLLSGKRPFDGETVTDILVKILTTEPPALRQVCPPAPAELEAIVEKAMRRVKGERYSTARDFADELSRFLAGEPIMAKPATVGRRLAKKAVRHRALLLGVAGAALALVAGLVVARLSRVEPPPSRDRLEEWGKLLSSIQDSASADGFKAEEAGPLLARAAREFPEQTKAVQAYLEGQHKFVSAAIAGIPRERWLDERARVERYRQWLQFAKRPTAEAERIASYRGSCTLEIHVKPFAELKGPLVARLSPQQRQTPVTLRDFEIADGDLELAHPEFGTHVVKIAGLENGKTYTIDGDWTDKGSIQLRGGP